MNDIELVPQWARSRAPYWLNRQACVHCGGVNYEVKVIENNEHLKTVEIRKICRTYGCAEKTYISECWTEWETCPRCNQKGRIEDKSVHAWEDPLVVLATSYKSECPYCGFEESFGY